jgi:hypothetical protein
MPSCISVTQVTIFFKHSVEAPASATHQKANNTTSRLMVNVTRPQLTLSRLGRNTVIGSPRQLCAKRSMGCSVAHTRLGPISLALKADFPRRTCRRHRRIRCATIPPDLDSAGSRYRYFQGLDAPNEPQRPLMAPPSDESHRIAIRLGRPHFRRRTASVFLAGNYGCVSANNNAIFRSTFAGRSIPFQSEPKLAFTGSTMCRYLL